MCQISRKFSYSQNSGFKICLYFGSKSMIFSFMVLTLNIATQFCLAKDLTNNYLHFILISKSHFWKGRRNNLLVQSIERRKLSRKRIFKPNIMKNCHVKNHWLWICHWSKIDFSYVKIISRIYRKIIIIQKFMGVILLYDLILIYLLMVATTLFCQIGCFTTQQCLHPCHRNDLSISVGL